MLLTAVNSTSVNVHLHCSIINLITVVIVCLLLRNSVFKIISKCVCIYIEEPLKEELGLSLIAIAIYLSCELLRLIQHCTQLHATDTMG